MSALRNAARRLVGRASPNVRRMASGLYSDMLSIPARLKDPARWGEPWSVVHNVGGGDFKALGEHLLHDLITYGGLRQDDRVLDIGCGSGRVAAPLARHLSAAGGYVGFDVSRTAVDYCRRRIGSRHPNFAFVHADIANRDYNPSGAIAEADYRCPVEDGAIDLAFATSVFSHMQRDAIAHNLAEAARSLRPQGRFLFTAFVLTPKRRAEIAAGQTAFALVDWGPQAMVLDVRSPERAIAHEETVLHEAIRLAGFTLDRPWLEGGWAPGATYDGGQDLFVLRRASTLDIDGRVA